MTTFNLLLAKSTDGSSSEQDAPTYTRLVPHLRAVERAGESIVEVVGELILDQLELPKDVWLSRLKRAVRVACFSHDLGKANDGFQKMVRGEIHPTIQPARHELLTALILEDPTNPVREWALEHLREPEQDDAELLLDCVIGAVAGHHLKLDEEWKKAAIALRGGCGRALELLLSHPDLRPLFGRPIAAKEIVFSLVEGDLAFIGNRRFPFNIKSNRWRERLKRNIDWWRFAAVVKALVAAADVAGSAMLPEKENIRRWVHETLCQKVTSEEMQGVVEARLKGKRPRPFQEAIGNSRKRVTLVEAGCGSGKTAAAYLWAAHHANGKKLFFCYPTTGTATEGFKGYVAETDIEAKLIHSRAIVDLEGIAKVKDDEEGDHLLRIESLSAWSPQVVICTADTVLALPRNNRRGLYNSPAILSGAFVFDEVHAYDNRMIEAMTALIKALPGASFLLMSASLPKARKDFLQRQIGDIQEVQPPSDLEEIPRYEFKRNSIEDAFSNAQAAVMSGRRVLWICNRVAESQKVFKRFDNLKLNARNYHSRFKYTDRKAQHQAIVDAFANEATGEGIIAVTTQVAEMSLDLDADLLISESAPIPALIQRLGRLNRRVTPENNGTPRTAIFLQPELTLPYKEEEMQLADDWIDKLMKFQHPLSQADLSNCFNDISPQEELIRDIRTGWLDSGWLAEPEHIRDIGYTVSVILPEDEQTCLENGKEIINRTIPMNYSEKRMNGWREFKGNLIAPPGVIDYDPKTGATLI
jgi:CRISPR-associated endonuclease/helicase Cas3